MAEDQPIPQDTPTSEVTTSPEASPAASEAVPETAAKVPDYKLPPADDGRHFSNLIPKQKKSKGRKILTIVIVLLVLAALAVGAYFLLKPKKATPKQTASTQQTPQEAAKTTITSTTKTYSSVTYSLSVTYPEDWVVKEPTDATTPLTITSPLLSLKAADGTDTTGKIVFTVQKKTDQLPQFDEGNASAAIDSLKITYTKPSQSQRGSTYVSFLRYASTANDSGLDGIYITGDAGYTKDQFIPKVYVAKVDPLITYTFVGADGKPLSIAASMWQDPAFQKPLQSMLESLNVR